MAKYKHLIITRFNLPWGEYGVSGRSFSEAFDESFLTDDWYLSYRLQLFEKTALRSILMQTDLDFEYLLLFYDKTPERYKERISDIIGNHDNIKAYYLSDEESGNLYSTLCTIIDHHVNDEEYVLSTRIDNDDMFAKDFVHQIHQNTEQYMKNAPSEYLHTVFSYPYGVNYTEEKRLMLKYIVYNSHFTSMCATYKKGHTEHIYNGDHTKINDNNCDVRQIRTEYPMWLEYIHKYNYANATSSKISTGFPVIIKYERAKKIYDRFELDIPNRFLYFRENTRYLLELPFRVFYTKFLERSVIRRKNTLKLG